MKVPAIQLKHFIGQHGMDMPETRKWKWTEPNEEHATYE